MNLWQNLANLSSPPVHGLQRQNPELEAGLYSTFVFAVKFRLRDFSIF